MTLSQLMTHGWGSLMFENLELGEPRHIHAGRGTIEDLWAALAVGNLARIEEEDWLPGYGF